MATFLYKNSALGYDGMTYDGPVQPLTPNQSFYVVTKNLIDPAVFQPAWRLEVTGKVAHPKTYQLSDLTSLPNCTTQETTLECISNGVGRGLISNAAWHGVSLRTLLDPAAPMPGAVGVTFRAVDGYVHTASLDTAMADGTFLAWLMNGQPLPDRHGYPLAAARPERLRRGERQVADADRGRGSGRVRLLRDTGLAAALRPDDVPDRLAEEGPGGEGRLCGAAAGHRVRRRPRYLAGRGEHGRRLDLDTGADHVRQTDDLVGLAGELDSRAGGHRQC